VGGRGPQPVDGLQGAEHHRALGPGHDSGGGGKIVGGNPVALRLGDGGAFFAFGGGLAAHDPLQILRHLNVLKADGIEMESPFGDVFADDSGDLLLDFLAFGEQLVERQVADHVAQGRLRVLRHGEPVVLHADHRLFGVDDLEEEHAFDRRRDVVQRDDLLPRNVQRQHPLIDEDRRIDEGNDIEHPRPGNVLVAAEPQHHPALPLRRHPDSGNQREIDHGGDNEGTDDKCAGHPPMGKIPDEEPRRDGGDAAQRGAERRSKRNVTGSGRSIILKHDSVLSL